MSGPIVRKYGFPNFEQIFGAKPAQHGVDDEATPTAEGGPPAQAESSKRPEAPAKSDETKS